MAILIKDLYCEICELQFDKKAVFNIHLSFVHGKNQLKIKEEEEVLLCEDKSINLVTDFWAPSHEKYTVANKFTSANLEIKKISNTDAKYVTETQSTSQTLEGHDSTLEFINSIEFCDEVTPKLETKEEPFEPDNGVKKELTEIKDEFQNSEPCSSFQSTRSSSSLEIFAVQPKAIPSTSSNSLQSKSKETEIEIIDIQKTSDAKDKLKEHQKKRQKDYLLPTKNTFKYLKYQDGLLFCRLCSESFSSKSELINHIKKWENGGCGKRNKSAQPDIDKEKDIFDLEEGTPPKVIPCQLCNKFFRFKSQLPIHFKEDHGKSFKYLKYQDGLLFCRLCSESFSSKSELINHIKKWENGGCGNRNKSAQPYIDKDIMDLEVNTPSTILCPLCNKFLKFKSQLPIHFKEDHGSEPICTFCMKVFQSREELSEHILITSCFDRHQRRKKKVQTAKIIDLDRPNVFNEEASLKKQKTSDVEIVDLD